MARDGSVSGGRKKGSLNKENKAIREMIIEALDELGGVDYLVTQAKDNPNAFMSLLAKVLPTQITGDPENPLVIKGVTVGYKPPNNSAN